MQGVYDISPAQMEHHFFGTPAVVWQLPYTTKTKQPLQVGKHFCLSLFFYTVHIKFLLRHCHDPLMVRLHKYCVVLCVTISIQLSDCEKK